MSGASYKMNLQNAAIGEEWGGGGGNSIVFHLSFLTYSAYQYDVT